MEDGIPDNRLASNPPFSPSPPGKRAVRPKKKSVAHKGFVSPREKTVVKKLVTRKEQKEWKNYNDRYFDNKFSLSNLNLYADEQR